LSVTVEQAKWAVRRRAWDTPPGCVPSECERGIDWNRVDVDAALRGLSCDISGGSEVERLEAVEALVWLADRRAISPLLRALRDCSWWVRRAAAHGLCSFRPLPDWSVDPLVVALSRDPNDAVRGRAATALGKSESEHAVAPLVTALDDPSRPVRRDADVALRDLAQALGDRLERTPCQLPL
jgi:HEAT repeat protein